MPNRLAAESSPYLQQHASNPVDWYPWGEEAFAAARAQQKPILLSIGYSSCHWCHVMARESFESLDIALRMNEGFVCIKVDREEHPDVDRLFQTAVALMGEAGGWPLTVFLTPDLAPFFGGTYFPPSARYGRPGFAQLLESVRESWEQRRSEVAFSADWLRRHVAEVLQRNVGQPAEPPTREQIAFAGEALAAEIDPDHGGFGPEPKFPSPVALELMLRAHRRGAAPVVLDRVLLTLEQMAAGGLFDQLGGGFHRYSVDAAWQVPHFEKMLYDNAQLLYLYTEAWQLTGRERFHEVVGETIAFLERELRTPEGAFCASLDADTEGEEGRFYAFSPAEVAAALGPERARLVCAHLGIGEKGNFHGALSVPRLAVPLAELARAEGRSAEQLEPELAEAMRELFSARQRRARPARDEKVLAGWNGLAIGAIARAARAFGRPDWTELATRAASFVMTHMLEGGTLWRSWRDGTLRVEGRIEDYGNLAEGLIELSMATLDPSWAQAAARLAEMALDLFWDEDVGAFLEAPGDEAKRVAPVYSVSDDASPSGASTLCNALVALAGITSQSRYLDAAYEYLRRIGEAALVNPEAFGRLLCAADAWLDGAATAVVAGVWDEARPLLAAIARRYEPTLSVLWAEPGAHAPKIVRRTLAGKDSPGGRASIYLCRNLSCRAPASRIEELEGWSAP